MASETERLTSAIEEMNAYLKNASGFLQVIKAMVGEVVVYMKDAESEVPEKMRRFIMYMHDVHDVMNMYVEHGLPVPDYILREAERCDDRYRHLLKEGHTDGGWIEKVRREMSKEKGNRWNHSRLLPTEKGLTG
jgi:uncharacterized NAD(P)/FAD-binding protein YdhS